MSEINDKKPVDQEIIEFWFKMREDINTLIEKVAQLEKLTQDK